ncbi:MAG: AAA family ATPase [Candidatus Glassbacteria bacterium]
MLIGLTAKNAAGKDQVAGHLVERHGFRCFSLSDILRQELRKMGREITRENLTETGNRLRREQGPGVLARLALEALAEVDRAVVVSIRNPGEVQALRSRKDFLLVGVDAPVQVRFERARRRARTDDAATLEDFIRQEEAELKGSETEQQLEAVFRLSDRIIVNDGSLDELYRKVEALL